MKKLLLSLLLTVLFHFIFAQDNTQGVFPNREIPLNDIVKRELIKQKPLLQYTPVREADILWEKHIWRVIDTREKINLSFRYPKKPLFDILYEGIEKGLFSAYSTEDDQFSRALAFNEIRSQVFITDTVRIWDIETGEERIQVIENEIDLEDIKRYRLQELWYFDSNTSTLKVRIIGIAPLKERYDNNGNYIGEMPMFWVSYAEAREFLAGYEVFNPHNDRSLMTWEDLFEMRYFASHIYKESNIHDQRLQDYLSGTHLLLEADKIKQTIHNWEHDLWSY